MRSSMKHLFVAAVLVAASLAASRPALAQCDYACTVVDPETFCERCLYSGPGAGACQDSGVCGCFDVQCWAPSSAEEALRIDLGIAPKTPEMRQCAARIEPKPAPHLPFVPART